MGNWLIRLLTAGVLFSLVVAVHSAPAQAQLTDDERARQHFQAGRSYYDQARYEDALREFKESYRLSGRHTLLMNLALVHEHLNQFEQAADALFNYLEKVENVPDRKTLESRLEVYREKAAEQARATKAASEAQEQKAVEEHESPSVASPPLDASAAQGDETGGLTSMQITGVALAGVGVAAGVAALITGLSASSIYGDLEENCGAAGACAPEWEDDIDSGSTLADVSTILTGAAVITGAAGAALFFLGGDDNEQHPAVSASVSPRHIHLHYRSPF